MAHPHSTSDALPARFWGKVNKNGPLWNGTPCWLWTAAKTSNGYGVYAIHVRPVRRVHRLAYEALVGPIPDGLDLDHLCRNRLCVNPDHLEPVTRTVNLKRGAEARGVARPARPGAKRPSTGPGPGKWRRTKPEVCKYGHAYTPENTYVAKSGWWSCKACHREYERERRKKKGL